MSQHWLTCKSMYHSITLEMNVRLLTGLKFGKIGCNPSFLSKGLTTATFQSLQKHPSPREMLTILVISEITFGSIFLSIVVSIVSNSQELDLSKEMTLLT